MFKWATLPPYYKVNVQILGICPQTTNIDLRIEFISTLKAKSNKHKLINIQ